MTAAKAVPTRSMTGFAAREGTGHGRRWSWEIRAVNGRGLDIRLRLPEGLDGLEAPVRARVQERTARGNVTVTLRLAVADPAGRSGPSDDALDAMLGLLTRIEERALAQGISLQPPSAGEVVALRSAIGPEEPEEGAVEALREAVLADLGPLLDEFDAVRRAEGAALSEVLAGLVEEIETLVGDARGALGPRAERQAEALSEALERLTAAGTGIDEARFAAELAVIASRSDVTEELDRLDAHVGAARTLLDGPGPKGRQLDFLTQEFNREANTLCSKSGSTELTRIGLAMKHAVDRMREQVQNLE